MVMVPDRLGRESSTTALKAAAEDKRVQLPLIKEAVPVPMVSAGKHGRLQEAVVMEKRCILPMISAGKHGRLQEAVVMEKRCIVPMISAGKHGRLQRAVV